MSFIKPRRSTASPSAYDAPAYKAGGLPLNRYLVEQAIPDEVWQRARALHAPPVGWDAIPAGKVSLDEGDAWLKANDSALMIVASVIVSEEFNVLINPLHADIRRIRARKLRKWVYDPRLMPSRTPA